MSSLGHINEPRSDELDFSTIFNDLSVVNTTNTNDNFETGNDYSFSNVLLASGVSTTTTEFINPIINFQNIYDNTEPLNDISDYFRLTVKFNFDSTTSENQGLKIWVQDSDGNSYQGNENPGRYNWLQNYDGTNEAGVDGANELVITADEQISTVFNGTIDIYTNSDEFYPLINFIWQGQFFFPDEPPATQISSVYGGGSVELLDGEFSLQSFRIQFNSNDIPTDSSIFYKLEAH